MKSKLKDAVIGQLERIIASPQIHQATVLADFLKYVVSETIEGRGTELKEYKIAVEALHKNNTFDPQVDSIVRIHAGRLRRALKEYYHEDGKQDMLIISIPKGTYVPVFDFKMPDTDLLSIAPVPHTHTDGSKEPYSANAISNITPLRENKPTIFVYPFNLLQKNQNGIYQPLAEYLSTELTKFEEVIVVSNRLYNVSQVHHLHQLTTALGIDYMLTGTVQIDDPNIRIFVQLISHDGKQLWAQTFEKLSPDETLWALEDRVITKTLASIVGFNGVIALKESSMMPKVAELDTHRVLSFWYKEHTYSFDPKITSRARSYYEEIISREPTNALALAYLSEIITGQSFYFEPHQQSALLQRSLMLAEQAISLDPSCQHAYQALALVTMQFGKHEECIRILEKGLMLNSKSVDYVGAMGSLLIFLGHYERGFALIEKVVPLNPAPPWGHMIGLSLYAFYKGEYEEALRWSEGIKANTIWVSIVKMATYAHLNRFEEGALILQEFNKNFPAIDLFDEHTLEQLFFNVDSVKEMRHGINKLGNLAVLKT